MEREEKDELHAYSLPWSLTRDAERGKKNLVEKSIEKGGKKWDARLFSGLKLNTRGVKGGKKIWEYWKVLKEEEKVELHVNSLSWWEKIRGKKSESSEKILKK